MASTTKIMTGLLACESGRLDETFTVPAEALKVEGSSMGLVAGEKLTLRELTYGLLLESGNDAAGAIACLMDGSIPAFAERMNRRAGELSLTGTHFANPSGLDDAAHYTTALDLARLGAVAMKNAEFSAIVSTYTARVPYNGIQSGRLLCNHNELLNLYEGTIGIKTGYTRRSGRCLVSCAVRNGDPGGGDFERARGFRRPHGSPGLRLQNHKAPAAFSPHRLICR
jgi:D-alanyl-D-alanine carboxypeptidase